MFIMRLLHTQLFLLPLVSLVDALLVGFVFGGFGQGNYASAESARPGNDTFLGVAS